MKEELLFSLNTVLPLLLLVVIGYIIRKTNLLDERFYAAAEKLVFKVALPCNLFLNVYEATASDSFDTKLTLFCVAAMILTFLIPALTVPLFIKDNADRGAYIQGIYRSNFAILGLPLAERLFPGQGGAVTGMLMPFSIPIFNIFAVILLSIFAPQEKKLSRKEIAKRCIKGIITNPLIIGIAIGIPFMLTPMYLPEALEATVKYTSNLTTPLALICLGASICSNKSKGNIPKAVSASLFKVLVIPAVVVTIATLMGFRGVELGAILILFGGPTAVSSYIMAKNMGSNHELAGQILLISTILCSVTLFLGIYLLAHFSLIEIH